MAKYDNEVNGSNMIRSLSNNNKRLRWNITTLLKLTTDGHKASRGLSTTAELLL